jgi:hypothetical protein
MSFHLLNRRLHLYLGLALLPWFALYGVSSIPFSHGAYFEERDKAKGLPNWTTRFERAYSVPVPEGTDLRRLGARILKDSGVAGGSWGVYRQGPNRIDVYVHRPFESVQIRYLTAERKLVALDKRFRWDHFLTGMHAKGGFEQESLLEDSWGVLVDLVCIAILVWIASGIVMWWQMPRLRGWGWLALAGGCVSFAFFVWRL